MSSHFRSVQMNMRFDILNSHAHMLAVARNRDKP